jgi:hypothetical protein
VLEPGRGLARWVRAGVLVALTVLVSIGGHVLAGGTVHLSGPAALGVLALGAMCVAAADTRRSAREILPVVLVAQPVLHLLASMGGHAHAAQPVAGTPAATGAGLPMVAAHVAGAAVVSLLLAHADRLVWALAGLRVRLAVPAVVPAGPPAWRPVVVPHRPALGVPARAALRAVPARRGPPAVAVAR